MKKTITILLTLALVISIILPVIPVRAQVMSVSVSPTHGPVGTVITVTGTIVTFNGRYQIVFDADADGTPETVLGEGTAEGYSVTHVVEGGIPDAYAGSRELHLVDLTTGESAKAIFVVESTYSVKVKPSRNYEGGPFTITGVITGGSKAWGGEIGTRFRVIGPDGKEITDLERGFAILEEAPPSYGKFIQVFSYGPEEKNLISWGTYTLLFDVDKDHDGTLEAGETGLASKTFTVGLTDKSKYQRTQTVKVKAFVEADVTVTKWQVVDPTGNVVYEETFPGVSNAFTSELTWTSAKDEVLGIYTVKLITDTDEVYKSQTFTLNPAAFLIEFTSTSMGDIERTDIVGAEFYVKYPSGAYATSIDIPEGFKVAIFYNTTKVTEIKLDPLLNFDPATNKWSVSWKIPKNAVLGIRYAFNITVGAIIDQYGNVGPSEYASSGEQIDFFNVIPATLIVTTPTLVYPAPNQNLPRTYEAKASLKVTYKGDGSLFTADDLEWLNVTVGTYTVSLSASDYNPDLGLWIVKWKIPYDAPLGAYGFQVKAKAVVDKYGNKGPAADTGLSQTFNVVKTNIIVSDLKTDQPAYETGENVIVTFNALYPSGDKVTGKEEKDGKIPVKIGPIGAQEIVNAVYDATLGKWVAQLTIPDNWFGTMNVTIDANSIVDDASPSNTGPPEQLWVNFEVVRIVVIEVSVEIGSSYFPGETATFYAMARYRGAPYDLIPAEAFSSTLYRPDGVSVSLSATKVAPGVFKFSYTLPEDAPSGSYVATVSVFYKVAPYTYARGFGIVSFSVSPTLSSWNEIISALPAQLEQLALQLDDLNAIIAQVQGDVAVIKTDVGDIKANVSDLLNMLSDLNAVVTSVQGDVAVIKTDVGTIKADVSALKSALEGVGATLESVQGDVVTIKTGVGDIKASLSALGTSISEVKSGIVTLRTNLGTLTTTVDKINGVITSVQGDVVTIKTAVGEVKTSLSDIGGKVTSIADGVATIQTDVGMIKGTVTDIKDGVATIQTDVGTIKANVGDLLSDVGAVKTDVGDIKGTAGSTLTFTQAVLVLVIITLIVAIVAAIFARRG